MERSGNAWVQWFSCLIFSSCWRCPFCIVLFWFDHIAVGGVVDDRF